MCSSDLERVCLKALARRPSDRFAIAKDLADEIRWLLQNRLGIEVQNATGSLSQLGSTDAERIGSHLNPSPLHRTPSNLPSAGELDSASRSRATKVVPKGLRSFDAADSDFFLELLPGPFDREGLPEIGRAHV